MAAESIVLYCGACSCGLCVYECGRYSGASFVENFSERGKGTKEIYCVVCRLLFVCFGFVLVF